MNKTSILQRCEDRGLRMTDQRRVIAAVLDRVKHEHLDVEEIHQQILQVDSRISLSTVYRTLKKFEHEKILSKVDFGDGRARYEAADRGHHDHLIDIDSGEVIEFFDPEIERLQEKIAARLGYDLKGHRMELYATRRRDEKT